MNDTIFIFGVLPITFALVGFVCSMIFGPDYLRWYVATRAEQQKPVVMPPIEPLKQAA